VRCAAILGLPKGPWTEEDNARRKRQDFSIMARGGAARQRDIRMAVNKPVANSAQKGEVKK